jgi:hypothetical protein
MYSPSSHSNQEPDLLLFFLISCQQKEKPQDRVYTEEEIDYFVEIALNTEYGNNDHLVIKWMEDIRIQLHGEPTPTDEDNLDQIMAELGSLQSEIWIYTDDDPNVHIYFTSIEEFQEIESAYVPGSDGFVNVNYDEDGIYSANIFVLSDQEENYSHHILLEEFTQSIGLLNDSDWYEDSVFHIDLNSVTEYSEIDRAIISMLYHPDILPEMDEEEVRAVFAQ